MFFKDRDVTIEYCLSTWARLVGGGHMTVGRRSFSSLEVSLRYQSQVYQVKQLLGWASSITPLTHVEKENGPTLASSAANGIPFKIVSVVLNEQFCFFFFFLNKKAMSLNCLLLKLCVCVCVCVSVCMHVRMSTESKERAACALNC